MPDVPVKPPSKKGKRPFPTWIAIGVVCILVAVWFYRDKSKKTDREAAEQEAEQLRLQKSARKAAYAAVRQKAEHQMQSVEDRGARESELAAIENEDPEEIWSQHVAAESGSNESRLEPGVIRAPTIGRPAGGMHHEHESAMVSRRSSYEVQDSPFA